MTDKDLSAKSLLFDESNPRHRPVVSQQQALTELLRRDPDKLLTLAKDIAENGLSQIDRAIVMKTTDGYVTLEGNRRLAALKLLADPSRCPDPALVAKFAAITAAAGKIPNKLRCVTVESREEAKAWLDRRHGGEMAGAGTVRWSAMQRTRNASNPGHQERSALTTLDWLDGKSADGANQSLADLLDEVAEDKFTTFGRLAGDPDFRAYGGFDLKGDSLSTSVSAESVVARLTLVLEDFRAERPLTVTQLLKKDQRLAYIETLRERLPGADESEPGEPEDQDETAEEDSQEADGAHDEGETDGGSGAETGQGATKEGSAAARIPMKLFHGLKLGNCSLRVQQCLAEVQKLPLPRYPNSAAALIRMVIDLTVNEAAKECKWPQQKNDQLRTMVDAGLKQLDPTNKSKRYQDLRTQATQPNSIISTTTLNAFLHDPDFHPHAPDLRTISNKYTAFLSDLNDKIGEVKSAP